MSKKRRTAVPDFSSKKGPAARGPFGRSVPAPTAPPSPKAPTVKPQATSSKSGHRGQ